MIIIAVVASGGGDDGNPANPRAETEQAAARLYPDRPDAQREDQERRAGEAARIGDYEATVKSAGFSQSISEFESDGYLVADVTIRNRGTGAKPYNTFDWKLQTPGGQVLDPGIVGADQLGSGDLVAGGTVSGRIIFEIKGQRGDFYVIYKPDAFDAARGIWKATA